MFIMKQLNIFNDNGYTFIEIFIVILIIGLISTVIFTNSSKIQGLMDNTRVTLQEMDELLSLQLIVSSEAQKIKPPWFLKEYKYTKEDNLLRVNYYIGDMESELILDSSNGEITITSTAGILFHSNKLQGSFNISDNFIVFTHEKLELVFPLGVFLV